jgi:TP901 family phage tail tape measure protein
MAGAARMFGSLGDVFVHLRGNDAHFQAMMLRADRTLVRTATRMSSTLSSIVGLHGTAITRMVGATIRRLTIATAGFATASVAAFASFEEQMANVSTMLDDHTMRMMPAYTREIKKMAVEFGESTSTISRGLYDILSASIPPAKALDVLAASIKAARAGMVDTRTAADAITSVLNAYEMQAEDATKVSDILFATVKRGKITFNQLASSIGMVTSVAATSGLSFEEVSAAIATMTRAGMPAERAITSLRAIITGMIKPLDRAARVAQEDFGIAMKSSTFRTMGLLGVLKELKKATSEQIAAMFGNVRALTGLSAALQQVDTFAYDVNLMLNATGLTQKAFAKMTGTVVHQLRRMWQAMKIIAVDTGERLRKQIMVLTAWFIRNRKEIGLLAMMYMDRVKFAFGVVIDLVRLLRVDFEGEFRNLMQSLLMLFEAIGKSLVSLMIRTGKGMAKALKAGFFGDELDPLTLEKLTRERYLQKGGTLEAKKVTTPWARGKIEKPMPTDEVLWARSMVEVYEEHEGRLVESVFKGFISESKKYFAEFENEATKSTGRVGQILQQGLNRLAIRDWISKAKMWWEPYREGLEPLIENFEVLKMKIVSAFWGRDVKRALEQITNATKKYRAAAFETTEEIEAAFEKLYEGINNQSSDAFLFMEKQLNDTVKRARDNIDQLVEFRTNIKRSELHRATEEIVLLYYREWNAIHDLIDAYEEYQKRLIEIQKVKKTEDFFMGMRAGFEDLKIHMTTLGELGFDLGKTLQEGLVNSLTDAVFEARDLGDAFRELARTMAKMAMQWALQGMFNMVMPGLPAKTSHSGSIAGESGPTRLVPAAAFAFAPRAHLGLGPNERPIITTRDEGIFTPEQMEALAPVSSMQAMEPKTDSLMKEIQRNLRTNVVLVDERQKASEYMRSRQGRREVVYTNRRQQQLVGE